MLKLSLCLSFGAVVADAFENKDMVTVKVALRHDPALISNLEEVVYDLADTKSPRYGHWLSSDDLRPFVAASENSVAAASEWVKSEVATLCVGEDSVVDGASLSLSVTGQGDFLEAPRVPRPCALLLKSSFERAQRAETAAAAVIDAVFVKKGISLNHSPTPPPYAPPTPTDQTATAAAAAAAAAGPRHASSFKAAMATAVSASGSGAPVTLDSVGSPPEQKLAYGVPVEVVGEDSLQLVWGPGTFG
jgi:hypothetical protein